MAKYYLKSNKFFILISVDAYTDLSLLSIKKNDFLFIFGDQYSAEGSSVINELLNLYQSRIDKSFKAIAKFLIFHLASNNIK